MTVKVLSDSHCALIKLKEKKTTLDKTLCIKIWNQIEEKQLVQVIPCPSIITIELFAFNLLNLANNKISSRSQYFLSCLFSNADGSNETCVQILTG